MSEKRGYQGPLPSTDFRRQVADEALGPFFASISGEVNANKYGMPIAVARHAGRIKSVHLSAYCGYNSTSVPTVEADVLINNTTCLTTKPKLEGGTGSAGYQTTFEEADDAGATSAVLDSTAVEFAAGDIISWNLVYSGNGSPTVKTSNPTLLIEVEPI